jgi:hypothetical protein
VISAPKITYEVPKDGGKVAIKTDSGNEVTLTFPASAAGQSIGITPKSSADIGWTDGRFSDVIELTPNGLKLSEPVLVHSKQNDLMVLHLEEANGSKAKPEMLPLAANGKDLELRHFSAIAFVPPAFSCDRSNGWKASTGAAACQDAGAASTQLIFQCTALAYCVDVTSSCCVPPARANDGCRLGDAHLVFQVATVSNPSSAYPWCVDANGSGGAPAGVAGASSVISSSGGAAVGTGGTAPNLEGGASTRGGTASLGGAANNGGTLGLGGAQVTTGGTLNTAVGGTASLLTSNGGAPSVGGTTGSSSVMGSGGTMASTSVATTGGSVGSGGITTNAGAPSSGGSTASGGTALTGGTTNTTLAGAGQGATAGNGPVSAGYAGTSPTATNASGGAAGASSSAATAGTAGTAGTGPIAEDGDACLGWTDLGLPSGVAALNGVAAINDGLVLAVGTSSTTTSDNTNGIPVIATYDESHGEAWSTEIPATAGALRAAWSGGDGLTAVAVGNVGSVMVGTYTVTPDSADWVWEYPAGGPTADLYAVWGIDIDHFVVAGTGNTVYYYDRNAPNRWSNLAVTAASNFGMVSGIWGTSVSDFWVVNAQGGCPGSNQWHFVNGSWTADSLDQGCYATNAIWGATASDVWSVGYSKGAFSHYTGGNWSQATSYALSVPLNMNGVRGRAANRIWAVGDAGNVAVYEGTNWRMCTKPTSAGLLAVDVAPQTVWAVGASIIRRTNVSP